MRYVDMPDGGNSAKAKLHRALSFLTPCSDHLRTRRVVHEVPSTSGRIECQVHLNTADPQVSPRGGKEALRQKRRSQAYVEKFPIRARLPSGDARRQLSAPSLQLLIHHQQEGQAAQPCSCPVRAWVAANLQLRRQDRAADEYKHSRLLPSFWLATGVWCKKNRLSMYTLDAMFETRWPISPELEITRRQFPIQ